MSSLLVRVLGPAQGVSKTEAVASLSLGSLRPSYALGHPSQPPTSDLERSEKGWDTPRETRNERPSGVQKKVSAISFHVYSFAHYFETSSVCVFNIVVLVTCK